MFIRRPLLARAAVNKSVDVFAPYVQAIRAVRCATALHTHAAALRQRTAVRSSRGGGAHETASESDDARSFSSANEEAAGMLDPFATEKRQFGFGFPVESATSESSAKNASETMLGAFGRDATQVVGGNNVVDVVGVITTSRIGRINVDASAAASAAATTASPLCVELTLLCRNHVADASGRLLMTQDNVTVRVEGALATRYRYQVGSVVTVRGVLGLHPIYDTEKKRWRDNPTIHVNEETRAGRIAAAVANARVFVEPLIEKREA